ncbi:Putrescine-binding periplasmic protein [Alphaproteobacteria bacterium SO-S41]|nr:Putrescine-binding periplasmic protein [Alphaproteobacteria bacterium SO-S41]
MSFRSLFMATATLALAGAGVLLATQDNVSRAIAADGQEVTLFTFETLANDELLGEYVAKYGAKPQTQVFADEDEAFAKMRAGYAPDVMGPCSYEFGRWQEAGLLQPIDVTKLKYWPVIAPTLKKIPGAMIDDTHAWFVPQYWAQTSITYRKDLAPEYAANESWQILFDPKYQGRIAALEGVDDTVTLVAKSMGIDPYAMSPEQWAQVQDKLRELVANARVITTDQSTIAQGLASGELVAAITWSDSWATLKNDGVDVGFMDPKDTGRFTYVCGFTLHKDAKDLDKAYTLMDSGLSLAAARYLVTGYSNGSANADAMNQLTDDELNKAGLPRDVEHFLSTGTFQVRLPNKDDIIKTWNEIRAGL